MIETSIDLKKCVPYIIFLVFLRFPFFLKLMAPSSPLRGSLTLQDENDTSSNLLHLHHHARHLNLQEFEESSLTASSLSFTDSSIRCGASPLNNSFNQSATVAAYVVSKATSAPRNRCHNNNSNQEQITTGGGLSSSPLNTSTRRKRTTTTIVESKPHQREEQEEKDRQEAANIIIPAHLLLSPQRFIPNSADDHEQPQQQQQYFNPYDTIISPTAAHHHNRQSREIENDDDLITSASRTEQPTEQHRRGLSGVHEFFDDDDDLLLFDDAAQEVEELRQIADERQQTIFDLQAELSEAREVHKELARKNEILQSESRSLRSAMADEGSILGGLLLGSPSSSIAARFLGNENDDDNNNQDVDATFSSPRCGGGGLGSERNIKSYYQQLWLLQQQLQKSGNSILLQSPNSATRKTFCDAETSCGDDEYLSVSMRTVKKLPFDENENDDDQQQQQTNESATSPLAVDVNVNQVGGVFYLLPPKNRHSHHHNHRRTQQRNKNKAKLASAPSSSSQRRQYHQRLSSASSSFFSTTNVCAAMSQSASSAASCCSQCGNSADRLRGGKVDYKLMAKNSTAYGRSKFSFFRFLFDW